MTTADTLQLRENLLAELRDSTSPRSTADLAAAMPWKVERSYDPCEQLCHRAGPGVEVLECHRSWHLVQYRRAAHGYTGIYRHLRSLESQGLVRRTLREGRKRVCWTYIGDAQGHPQRQQNSDL
jgi:hypothetical protein